MPAVDADAFVPSPFTMVARGTGERWRVVAGRRRPASEAESAAEAARTGAPDATPTVEVDTVVVGLVLEA